MSFLWCKIVLLSTHLSKRNSCSLCNVISITFEVWMRLVFDNKHNIGWGGEEHTKKLRSIHGSITISTDILSLHHLMNIIYTHSNFAIFNLYTRPVSLSKQEWIIIKSFPKRSCWGLKDKIKIEGILISCRAPKLNLMREEFNSAQPSDSGKCWLHCVIPENIHTLS